MTDITDKGPEWGLSVPEGLHFFVLGATGRTGRSFVAQSLARGHRISAIVRDTSKIPTDIRTHPGLRIIVCELSDVEEFQRTLRIASPDVLVCMLGSETAPYTAVSTGTHSLLEALRALNVSYALPLISVASWGMGESESYINGLFMSVIVKVARRSFWSKPYIDFERQLAEIHAAKQAGLIRPTILLPPVLTSGQLSDNYLFGEPSEMQKMMTVTTSISRASLAHLCLELAEKSVKTPTSQWIAIAKS